MPYYVGVFNHLKPRHNNYYVSLRVHAHDLIEPPNQGRGYNTLTRHGETSAQCSPEEQRDYLSELVTCCCFSSWTHLTVSLSGRFFLHFSHKNTLYLLLN